MPTTSKARLTDPRHERVDVRLARAIRTGTMPKELLICGPAGTGKTYATLCVLHTLLADYPGLRVLVCRQTRRSLTDSVLGTFEREVLVRDGKERIAGGAGRGNRRSYRYPETDGEMVLCGLDRPDRAKSSSWDIIYVNEATEVNEEAWDTLGTRLERPDGDRRFGFLIADTNPADPAHWLKTRCDDGRTVLWDTTHQANPKLWDGRGWTYDGHRYNERLDRLRGSRRKRLRDGIWAAAEGVWFEAFGEEHVSAAAAYDPSLPVTLAVDTGVFTGAVAFQRRHHPRSGTHLVTVFYDYLSEGLAARANASKILAGLDGRTGSAWKRFTDPAGNARNPVGPTVLAEYEAAGLRLEPWPGGPVADALALVEALMAPQSGPPALLIHPSCKTLITAMGNYRRKKRGGQWADAPEDPQHPHEDLVDALRGGLKAEFPEGLKAPAAFRRTAANRFRY